MKIRDKTICLNMIVKNESHIIVETLDHLHKIFDFDYWVISDTGSTDNTQGIIKDFFKEKGVPGELIENEWKWFGESRTDALNAAYNKTDYLLIFDADDKIHGRLILPDSLTADSYHLKFKSNITYFRPLLISNRKKWKFKGVIHEVLSNIDPVNPSVFIDNEEYFVESRRLGNFNLDPLKYQKQAKVLEDAFYKEMELKDDIGLANRYAYYCARSYRDAGDNDNAIIWFKKVINDLTNWSQEKYCSCIEVGDIFSDKKDIENSLLYYLKSVDFDNERIEGVIKAINLLFSKNLNILAISLYNQYKNYNHNIDTSNRLFIEEWMYRQLEMDFRVSIKAYYVKGQEKVGYEACKKIINNKKYEHHSYLQTVWNLNLHNYKKFIPIDSKDETIKLHQVLSDYIIYLDSKNFKEKDRNNWNVVMDLWKYINNFINVESDLINKVKEIIQHSDLSLKQVSEMMCEYTFKTKEHNLAIAIYNKYKNIKLDNNNKNEYYSIRHMGNISASYANDVKAGYNCCKELIMNDIQIDRQNVFYNMKFYIKEIENDPERELLLEKIYNFKNSVNNTKLSQHIWDYSKYYIEKYIPSLYNLNINSHKIESARLSKKILIYTGFAGKLWNYSTAINSALGGSEKAVAFMSKELPSDYEIYISGDVQDEKVDNITYINRSNLNSLLESTEFHTIIVSRYVSFFLLYPAFKCYKLIISAHDTTFLNNSHINTPSTDIIHRYIDIIDYIVVLTEWHKNNIVSLHDLSNYNNKFHIINNGVITNNLSPNLEYSNKKIKNSFIYTSRPERGLERLLELWPSILEQIPDATLNIATYEKFPVTSDEIKLEQKIKLYNSIKFLGNLNENQLKEIRSTTEYWLYPNCFPETSCITALEMLLSEVICMYYPYAGLSNTLGIYGIKVSNGDEINTLNTVINLTEEQKDIIKLNGKKYALKCSWVNRADEWKNLITYNKEVFEIEKLIMNSKKNKAENVNQVWAFYSSNSFNHIPILEYINHINEIHPNYIVIHIHSTIDLIQYIKNLAKLTFVYYSFDEYNKLPNIIKKNVEISILNTEPLTTQSRFDYIKNVHNNNSNIQYYDYSNSNITILKNNNIGFKCMEYIPASSVNSSDVTILKNIKKSTKIIYDFGILTYPDGSMSHRRQAIVNKLKEFNYTVNIINGWDEYRDIELAKCNIILNIHGNLNDIVSKIFEHLRCDRLLYSGFNVLSENCDLIDNDFTSKFSNLKFIEYNDFFDFNKIQIIKLHFFLYN
jgi:hypothetical protein